jgi:hypothetical protein
VSSLPGMRIDPLLDRQAGVISRRQALAAGLTGAAVDHRLRTRRWRPLYPRVYLVRGHRYDDEARTRAAVLWAGGGAVLSGATAAWWHGLLAEAPGTLGLTAPVRRDPRPGVVVRHRPLAAADRTHVRGLPVTAVALKVLEAAVELGPPTAGPLLDDALQRWVRWTDVLAAHDRNPGSPAASRMLTAAAARSAAAADAALVRLLCDSGIRGWHRSPAGPPGTVVFPAARVAVHAVGWAPCGPAPVARPGRHLLRFGWAELTGSPCAVLAGIARVVTHGRVRAGRPGDNGECTRDDDQ